MRSIRIIMAVTLAVIFVSGYLGCRAAVKNQPAPPLGQSEALDTIRRQCEEQIGPRRVERISEHVWAALGHDLASTALIHTSEGNIIVDTSICCAAARAAKEDLLKAAPGGPVKAVIYTHSHVDHTMGTTVWAENGTRIWATDGFQAHWIKQYGLFGQSENTRGRRQMAFHISREEVPCSSVGPLMRTYSLNDMAEMGPLMPTDTFTGVKVLEIGGLKVELHSAPGETHDTLFVWVPDDGTLLCADDYYWAFPNLYTIRGTSPRPTEEWIKSIDGMRRLQPQHLLPSHTNPLHGEERIQEVLRNYRDAIQYVRDDVVRRANRGEDIDTISENVNLPPQLAQLPYLWEGYGQLDWSARAIYTNNLGWFDGRADRLYPINHDEAAQREIKLMGGAETVLKEAQDALKGKDYRWAVHLLGKLKDSGLLTGERMNVLNDLMAQGLTQIAAGTANTNGRAYLLEYAMELSQGPSTDPKVVLPVQTVQSIPLDFMFDNMAVKLDPAKAQDMLESVHFVFPDANAGYYITIRNGIAEVIEGNALPGTPQPAAVVTMDSLTFKLILLKMLNPLAAVTQGKITVEGDAPRFLSFMARFQT